MIFKNVSGTTRSVFSLLSAGMRVYIGTMSKAGILQGQDADKRTIRDLVQYMPRWKVIAGHTQIATEYEVHRFDIGPILTIEEDAAYILDAESCLIL